MAIERLNWELGPSAQCQGGAMTIGNFDGVHRGHGALLAELKKQAAAVGGPAVAVTFDPHPLQLLHPERFQPVLTTLADRAAQLQHIGADHVVILHTTPELLQLGANDFFAKVIRDGFRARAVVEGENFGFGRDREGDVARLRQLCGQAGMTFTAVSAFTLDGVPVSSSRVRNCLVRGAVSEATTLLGRPYRLRGVVSGGDRRGRTIGFPTANLEQIPTLIPRDGVYAVGAVVNNVHRRGALNIGPTPTLGVQARNVELHLLDFARDLYGQQIDVVFVERLRDTRPFDGVEALVAQLRQDVQRVRELIADRSGEPPFQIQPN